ncbi:MAG: OmpA family protein [Desulfocapsaceae bacterium]|jgi:peptidoglycan-associated lipoprotein|nr:OmpA family protein [Desulfocapsaceae bacterium]
MKKIIVNSLLAAILTGSLVFFSAGCAKKSVIPPSPTGTGSSAVSEGKDINYPRADGSYSENSLLAEGTLDDSSPNNVEHLGSLAIDATQGEASAEYKEKHGRSSQGFLPIYFDFDQAGVRPDMADRMIINAEQLQQVVNTVIIEGNCDDRGTKEYNLALAERRAINVRDYLVNLGVDPMRVRTVSYGEERPLFYEQNEFSWSQNRRADFVLE